MSLEESLGVPWAAVCTLLSVIVLSDSDLAVALFVLEFSNPDRTESESESRRIEKTIGNHRNCQAAIELTTMFMRIYADGYPYDLEMSQQWAQHGAVEQPATGSGSQRPR